MRIATFNLENLGAGREEAVAIDRRLPVLRPQLDRLAADVLCLQELNAVRSTGDEHRRLTGLDRLLEGSPYEPFHRAVSVNPDTGGPAERHNLAILSRWPIRSHRQVRHDLVAPATYAWATGDPPRDPQEISWDRPVLHAAIERPGGAVLHVINVHLRAPIAAPVAGQKTGPSSWKSVAGWAEGFFLAGVRRAGQALELRILVDQLFDKDAQALIAVAGDFNAEEREVPLRIVRGDVEDTGSGALAARSLVLLDRTVPRSRRFSLVHGGQRLMLDHILVSRPLLGSFRSLEIHNETLTDELADPPGDLIPDSHHAPVVAEFVS